MCFFCASLLKVTNVNVCIYIVRRYVLTYPLYQPNEAKRFPQNRPLSTNTMTKQEKLAQELADALNDHDSLQFYRDCADKYTEDFLRKKLQKVLSIPEDQIRKSRGALFTYLIRNHARHPRD